MRIRSAVAVAALALTAAACGTQPKTDSASGEGDASSTTAKAATTTAPKQTTTTKPKAKIKAQPDCQAYAAFSIGYSAVTFAKPEQKEEVVAKFQVLVDKLKQETPQFAAQIDTINFLTTKQATSPLTPEDKTALNEAFAPITEWNKTTCVIEPGA